MQHPRRPPISIPRGAQPPVIVNPIDSSEPYSFELQESFDYTPSDTPTPQQNGHLAPSFEFPPSHTSISRNRTRSAFVSDTPGFPQADRSITRSASAHSSHRTSKSDMSPGPSRHPHRNSSIVSSTSSVSSFFASDDESQDTQDIHSTLTRELSDLSLDSHEGLRRFQAGELSPADDEWHRLVPEAARDTLGQAEVRKQSVFFELIKSERDYTHDLRLVEQVFIDPLRHATPPVIPPDRLRGFISDVFFNLNSILAHHQRMLKELFTRQREQHPIIESLADIILDTVLLFREEYESYIKHYPLAEARHRKELKRNKRYQDFIQQCSLDPRISKRDLITFLTRPMTRLPRLSLVLAELNKYTDPEHADFEALPLILGILSDFLKSCEPGIQAAEGKVKFWELCESLRHMPGEIIDLDLYDESRTLVYSGPVSRKDRSEIDWHGWNDMVAALLDNNLILTKESARANGIIKRDVVSRPLPLQYLRLGSFNGPPENRKEKADDGRLLESLRFHWRPMYPFTIYHASSKSKRRYTLYVNSESIRKKWYDALRDSIGLLKARQEANRWFIPTTLNDGLFRHPGTRLSWPSGTTFTGRVTSATPFISGGRKYIALGCASGIYVGLKGGSTFNRVLNYSDPSMLIALHDFNKFLVHHNAAIYSYPLSGVVQVYLGDQGQESLEKCVEKVSGSSAEVQLARAGKIGSRTIIIYSSRKLLQINLQVLEAIHPSETLNTPRHENSKSFRPFGEPFYVPKDPTDIAPLVKTIAIITDRGIVIVDPTNAAKAVVAKVPDFTEAPSNHQMARLKARCDAAKPLGLVRCEGSELLVIYDTIGCYITKHGDPSRNYAFIHWESPAVSYAHRGAHLMLFSPEFIEIRNVNTGRLVQVIEGQDIRLLHCGPHDGTSDTVLAVMRGESTESQGISERILELVETAEIGATPGISETKILWDEWDM